MFKEFMDHQSVAKVLLANIEVLDAMYTYVQYNGHNCKLKT